MDRSQIDVGEHRKSCFRIVNPEKLCVYIDRQFVQVILRKNRFLNFSLGFGDRVRSPRGREVPAARAHVQVFVVGDNLNRMKAAVALQVGRTVGERVLAARELLEQRAPDLHGRVVDAVVVVLPALAEEELRKRRIARIELRVELERLGELLVGFGLLERAALRLPEGQIHPGEGAQQRARHCAAQAAEDQARAFDDQVQAAEDQARAAEDQVRAAEDQVQAAEDQVRAAEDQVRSMEDQMRSAQDQIGSAEVPPSAPPEQRR